MFSLMKFLLLLVCLIQCQAGEVATQEFLSRPDIIPPALNVVSIDNSTVSDGYMFISPEMHAHTNFTRAMYIYNNHGGMVWSGHKFNVPSHRITVFEGCQYQNAMHICVTFFNGQRTGGKALDSYSLILDDSYNKVQALAPSFEYQGVTLTQGLHEFHLVGDGSSALVSSMAAVRLPTVFEHCPGSANATFLQTSLFTEITTDGTNTTLFHWDALHYLNVTESVTCPGYPNTGRGEKLDDGVDFFHINAVDKNEDGDYIVSGRHTNTIYKIAGNSSPSGQQPGSIIWRLGGKRNDFHLKNRTAHFESGTFNFSFQHDSRFYSNGIRIFDNANSEITESISTPLNASAAAASGMDIEIDEATRTATLVYQAVAPSRLLSQSQGSHQGLDNGNHFCGLGSENEIFERTSSGALAFDAYIGGEGVASYRASKDPWVGNPPLHELVLFTYAHNASSQNAYYVSWNGATNVTAYRFFVSNSSSDDYVQAATTRKHFEFETLALGSTFGLHSFAEALDADGNVLGRTAAVKTFVPDANLTKSCDHLKCAPYTDYFTAPQAIVAIEMKYVNT